MTVQQIMERLDFAAFALPDPGREVRGGYAGDLLSWVMGRAPAGLVRVLMFLQEDPWFYALWGGAYGLSARREAR